MRAVNLRTEQLVDPLGIDVVCPYLSWNCQDGIAQTAYEIEAKSNGEVVWESGRVESSKMNTAFEGELKSRQRVVWRVRLWNEKEEPGEWSEEAFFEMGILSRDQFLGKWINPELICDPQVHKPASYLRTSFEAPQGECARLYITAHGLYEAWINGTRVGDFVLAPGAGTYDKKLAYQTYDVTKLINAGENHVMVILGDGWYRSCSGVDGDRNLYGDDVALYFQLEVDKKVVCISDENWEATQDGPIRENDMQQGEVYDANLELEPGRVFETVETRNWHPVKVEDFGINQLSCSNSVPIVECERFEGKIITTPNGETVIDYGQNLAGYIEFTLNARQGQKIVLHHGESLDENGNFTAENFQDRERHKEGGTEQRVIYTCKEGINHYKSRFTIWGFRYARVETDVDLSDARFTSIAVYSRMKQTGTFTCSSPEVNQLVKNSIWSQKSNFCDVPTDCPTRERAAWTGDMGVFAETGIFLEDCYPVIRKWLGECRLNQKPDGKIINIAPPNNKPTFFSEMLWGSVGWGDAGIIVPYVLYKRYDDKRILEENYEMMKGWMRFLQSRANQPDSKTQFENNPYHLYTIETGVDYGEWCEPGSVPQMAMAKPQYKVTTAYYSRSAKMLAEIAEILGKEEDAKRYREIAENAAKAFRFIATDQGKIQSDRQAEYVRAIDFGFLSEKEAQEAASDLNELVIKNGYHLNTGFLSTPSLPKVLAEHGFLDTAYKLLLQDTIPSWLYEIKQGATTIWETWDGIDTEGKVHASLNHYSYGAVCEWLFSGVCGIRLANGKVTIRPYPYEALEYARACYDSPVGTIVSGWKYVDGKVEYEFVVPANVTAEVILPDGRKQTLQAGTYTM